MEPRHQQQRRLQQIHLLILIEVGRYDESISKSWTLGCLALFSCRIGFTNYAVARTVSRVSTYLAYVISYLLDNSNSSSYQCRNCICLGYGYGLSPRNNLGC